MTICSEVTSLISDLSALERDYPELKDRVRAIRKSIRSIHKSAKKMEARLHLYKESIEMLGKRLGFNIERIKKGGN